jgi:hypothetical protein
MGEEDLDEELPLAVVVVDSQGSEECEFISFSIVVVDDASPPPFDDRQRIVI